METVLQGFSLKYVCVLALQQSKAKPFATGIWEKECVEPCYNMGEWLKAVSVWLNTGFSILTDVKKELCH